MITTLQQLVDYYKNFCPYNSAKVAVNQAGSHKQLGNFFYGDEDVLVDCVTNKAVFPLLFMQAPDVEITEDLQEVPIELHIVKPANIADYREQVQVQSLCTDIALALWARIRKEHRERTTAVDLKVKISPIYYVSIANYTGVKMSFTQYTNLDVCDNPLDFN